jgi:hypothetical protein
MVDLPDPDSPINARLLPRPNSKFTPLTTWFDP